MKKYRFDTILKMASQNIDTACEQKSAQKKAYPMYEFHVSKMVRDKCNFDEVLFATTGNVIFGNIQNVRIFAQKVNAAFADTLAKEKMLRAGELNAMGLIDEIFHFVCHLYRRDKNQKVFSDALILLDEKLGQDVVNQLFLDFTAEFPPLAVYKGGTSAEEYLESMDSVSEISNRVLTLEEMMLLHLANENPAFAQFKLLFGDKKLAENPNYQKAWGILKEFFKTQPSFGPNNNDLVTMLKEPVVFSPYSLRGQLDYIRSNWGEYFAELASWLKKILASFDFIAEENKPAWNGGMTNLPPMDAYNYDYLSQEYERYSPDQAWMPRVVLMAKTVLVWLSQLSESYGREITRLDQIPDEELDALASRGFTGLWLIGLWERSNASKRIKQINGNPEAAASAYSLDDYDIASNLGGWDALDNLRRRCWQRGIRLASDMVPNHTGMDAKWVVEKPDLFIQRRDCPFPQYTFNGENLSHDGRVSIYLEDHYYSKTDCSVVFKRVDNYTGDTRYIYHGNDGTGMPWNDTAQIDFLNPTAREEVIQKILHVARNFPIIRFDAAMVLAKKHIKRLWYPEPGCGGDIATRSESALSRDDFEERIPNEFWREVVDRCAKEIPDTLLLAEAFWMMEGYFVRTLGMHRVYNSAFMNMLKKEENYKYRQTVKNTLEFDPQVLRRFVNFMNNPDEETAVAQFGKGDKYFGVCTLMVTMPGLPMFGHGQIEGFTEKYGMEYQKAYWKETPDWDLIERHNKEIFPLMKKRYLFAEVDNFYFYDVWNNGVVNENIFAYSNQYAGERAVVFYNNVYEQASGWIKVSCNYAVKIGEEAIEQRTKTIAQALELSTSQNAYVIFQEQRSGLWYIRSCADVHQNGLFVALRGFESQVLLNFEEVTDDETGKWRILFETLAGRGVEDIAVALQEIFLKDLYAALTKFATVERFKIFDTAYLPYYITASRTKELDGNAKQKPADISLLLAESKDDALNYFKTLRKFILGNYGANQVVSIDKMGDETDVEKVWNIFASLIRRSLSIKVMAESPLEETPKEFVAQYRKTYETVLAFEHGGAVFAAFCILYVTKAVLGTKATALDASALARQFGLSRKLLEILKSIGYTKRDAKQSAAVMLNALACADSAQKNTKKSANEVLTTLFNSPEAVRITGLNEFNNVRWFGKELFEYMLDVLYSVQTLCTPEANMAQVASCYKAIKKAQKASDYQVDKLLEPFVQKPKKSKSAKALVDKNGKKASSKKTATKDVKSVKNADAKKTKKASAKKSSKLDDASAKPKRTKTAKAKDDKKS